VRELSRAVAAPPRVLGVSAISPMAGLERRAVGMVDVLAQSVGATAPTAAATTVPALIAGQTGGSVLGCLVLAWVLAGLVNFALGQFTRRMRAPGSLYTFTTRGLGTSAGFASAAAQLTGYAFLCMYCLVVAAVAVLPLVPGGSSGGRVATGLGVAVLGLACFLVLRRGIRLSARITLIVELVAVAGLLVAMSAVLAQAGWSGLAAPLASAWPAPHTLVAGIALGTTAFVGFESAAALGREARRPFRTIPRAMRWTVIGVGVAYVFSAYTQQIGAKAFGVPLGGNELVVPQLAGHTGIPGVAYVLEAALATSFLACAIASFTALSRVVFTLGREGLLPRAVGSADPLRGTPSGALVAVVPGVVGLPIVMMALGSSPASLMLPLISVSAVGFLGSYLLAAVAAPVFLHRIGELSRRTLVIPALTALVLAAIVLTYVIVVARDDRTAFVIVLLLAAAATAAGFVAHRLRPHAVSEMGLFDETTLGDLLGTADPAAGVR